MNRLDHIIYQAERFLVIFLACFMLAIVSLEVFFRYVLNTTLMVGVQEIAKWSFVWLSALGCSALLYRKGHVAVEYFVSTFLPPRFQHLVDLIGNLFLLTFLLVAGWVGFPFAIGQWHRCSTSAEIPTTFVFISVPVAMCFMTIHALTAIVNHFRQFRYPDEEQ